jgi:hypothetical protein
MSVYIQEVLGLLKRNKRKKKLDKVQDHFEFGKLYQTSNLNTGAAYNPKMEPFVVRWGDLVCEATEDLTRTQPGSGNLGFIPVYTTPEGSCSWDTLKDSIITQNAIGDTITINNGNLIVEGDLQVDQNANVNLQLTAGSANILDLTEDRIVIVGPNGELEDDANLTFDGIEFNIGQGNFTVQVNTGNTQIIGTLDVDDQATLASANVEDLTNDRIVIVGVDGELEDDPNFTMDGITFTALVNVQHGVPVVSPAQPTTNTVINSNIFLNGPVYDSQGNVGGLAQVLVGLADGRVIWSDDDVVEALTYGSLWQGNINNLKQELPIGTADQILISDGVTFSWQDNPAAIVGEQCAVYTIPLWTPDSNTLGCSKLTQDGDNSTPATNIISSVTFNVQNTLADSVINLVNDDNNQVNFFTPGNNVYGIEAEANGSDTLVKIEHFTSEDANLTKEEFISLDLDTTQTNNKLVLAGDAAGGVHPRLADGSVQINVDLELEDVPDNNALEKVLVRDTTTGLIRQRDASTIKPQVGFDTLEMLPDGWASTDGNFNSYVKLDDTTTAVKNIKDMDWLVDGDRVVVIAENIKTGSLLADNVIRFPSWSSSSFTTVSNHTSWNQASIGTGWTGAIDNGYQTSTLLYGEKLKFKAELYEVPSAGTAQLNWDACCKIYSDNTCPTGSNGTATIDEDTSFTGSFNGIDDGYGGYGLTYSIVSGPSNGSVTLTNASTGYFEYTPNANYFGTDVITWEVSDGYCTSSQYTFTITINAVDDAPVWTSTDPVTANTYPNLTGGDTWTYNWTVADIDTPCANLTFPNQTIPAWLTFTNNGDCTGTLTGTFPSTGGIFPVQLNVSDGTSTASQSFEIGGLAVDNDTYFVTWFDGSGSMDTTGRILSQISSTPTVVAKSDGTGSGTTTLTLQPGVSNDVGMYVDDPSGDAYNGYELLVVGMTVSGTGIPAGTTIVTAPTSNNPVLTLSNNHTTSVNDIITFARTAAQKTADYNDINTFRNLLQDFYATGATESSGNTNPATNGADRYDTHVKFGWDAYPAEGSGERQIQYLANLGNPINTGAGQLFENASTVVIMAWGDESDNWYYQNGAGTLFTDPTTGNGLKVANDVAEVQQFITTSETNAGNNQIYRGILFTVGNTTIYRQIGQGLQNGISPNSQFGGTWTNADLLTAQSSGSPTRIQYAGQTGDTDYPNGITANNNAPGYYRSVVLAKLQDSGFTTLT